MEVSRNCILRCAPLLVLILAFMVLLGACSQVQNHLGTNGRLKNPALIDQEETDANQLISAPQPSTLAAPVVYEPQTAFLSTPKLAMWVIS
jgi:hypothetical protein